MAFVSLKSILKSQLPVGKAPRPKRLRIVVQIPAGNASVTPPLGPLLGQFGLNIMEFCKDFNGKTNYFEKDLLLTTIIYIEPTKQYSFEVHLPNIAYLISVFLFDKQEQGLSINVINLLRYFYDVSLLYLIFEKIVVNDINLKSLVFQMVGTLKSFQLIFRYRSKKIANIYRYKFRKGFLVLGLSRVSLNYSKSFVFFN